jgi:hypothetical protein
LLLKPHFGPKRGMTFLNVINDQAFGTGHKIVAGTGRDCLHAIDLFFSPGAANLPEVLVTDAGSYSDLIFGIASVLGVDYRPRWPDGGDGREPRVVVLYGLGQLHAGAPQLVFRRRSIIRPVAAWLP